MTTLDTGISDVPLPRMRSVMALAAAVLAVVGFVVVSLVLKSVADLALTTFNLSEDVYGQCAEYIVVTAVSMFAVRKAMDATSIRYSGKAILSIFVAIIAMVLAFALTSGFMKVDFLVSVIQMSALGLFAYLQFWTHDGRGH